MAVGLSLVAGIVAVDGTKVLLSGGSAEKESCTPTPWCRRIALKMLELRKDDCRLSSLTISPTTSGRFFFVSIDLKNLLTPRSVSKYSFQKA